MPAIWTDPKTWVYKDVFSATQANIQLRDNLLFLKNKPKHIIELKGLTNYSASLSTSFGAIDDSTLTLSLTTSEANEDVWLSLMGTMSLNASGVYVYFDWLMDSLTWVSSGTITGLASGVALQYLTTSGVFYGLYFRYKFTVPTAGLHTFKLRMRASSGTHTLTFANNTQNFQLGVQVG